MLSIIVTHSSLHRKSVYFTLFCIHLQCNGIYLDTGKLFLLMMYIHLNHITLVYSIPCITQMNDMKYSLIK